MKLVPNARKAWRWFSVQCMALAGAVQATWISLPPDLQQRIPDDWVSGGTVALAVLGILGRVVDQGTAT
jgi:hypothetical protein